jgi:PAS domain S-box-containing protein
VPETLMILLVEDNPGDVQLIREYATGYSGAQCSIESCSTMKQALSLLTSQSFDAVLLDLSLPDSQGVETVRKVCEHSPTIPIVALTGASNQSLAEQAIQLGAQDFLSKQSLTPDLLCRTVTYAIERSHIRRDLRISESRHRLLVESAPVSIVHFSPNGDIISINPLAAKRWRRQSEDCIGMNIREISPSPLMPQRITTAVTSRKTKTYEDVVGFPDGTLHVLRSYTPIYDADNTVSGVQMITSDITEQKDAELRFQIAARTASDLIYEWDLATDSIRWFGDVDRALGYPQGTIEHTVVGWSRLLHPDDAARLKGDSTLSHRTAAVPIHQEYRVRTADGTWRTWIDRSTPMLDDQGAPTRWIGVCEDVTAERLATSALESERMNLLSVMESMPAFLYLQSPNHQIAFANKQFHKTFGDPKGKTCHEIFRDFGSPCVPCATLDVLATRQEIVREWTDEQGRVFELRERPFTSSDHQDCVLVIGTEITNLVQATQDLRVSEQRFRELAELLPEVLFECTLDGKLTYANRVAFQRFGYSQQEFDAGLHITDMVAPEDLEQVQASIAALLSGGKPRGRQYTAIRANGDRFPITIHTSIVQGDEKPVGLRGIIVDITEQVAAQQAIHESEARLRQLFESAPIGIGYHSIHGKTLAINATAASRLEGNREDYLGKDIAEYYKDPEEVRRRFALALESSERRTYEDRVERQDKVLWYQRTYTAIHNTPGEAIGVQVISNDITAQADALRALEESEARLRTVLDTVPDLLFQLDAEDRVCMYHAPEEELFVPPDKFLGTKLGSTMPKESSKKMIKALQDLKQSGKTQRVEYSLPMHGVMKDYEARLIRGDAGRTLIMIRDISARKQALKALEVADDILRHTPIGMFIFAYEEPDRLVLVDTNPEAERLTGLTLSEWVGRELNEMWPDARAAGLTDAYFSTYTNNAIFNSDSLPHETLHPTSKYRIRAFRIPDDRLVVSFEDISEQMDAQRKLQESEQQNRIIVATSPVGILTVNFKGTITSANRAFLEMTGYGEDEMVGKHFTRIPAAHIEDLPKYLRTFRSLLIGKIPEPFESSWTTKDGKTRHGEIQVVLMQPVDKAWSAQVIVQDVTDRHEAQEALQESELKYRSLFENAPLGIFRTTPDGRILAANNSLVRMLGCSSFEELAAINLEEEGYEAQTPRSLFKQMIEEKGYVEGLEFAWKRKDGATIYLREHSHTAHNIRGNTAYYEGTLEDITERKIAEQHLQESEATQRGILQASPIGIGLIRDGKFQWVSNSVCEMCGYANEELVGQSPLLTAQSSDEYKRIQQDMSDTMSKHGVAETETQWMRKDGSQFDVNLRFASLDPTDPSKGGIFSLLDITARKRMEESLQLTQYSIDSTDVIILWLRSSGEVVFVSKAACRMLGYTADEMLTKYAWDITLGYPRNRRKEMWDKLKTGGIEVSETLLLRKDGTQFPAEISAQYLSYQNTEYEFVYAIDITERKVAEAALQQSEVSYRTIFESVNEVIMLHDAVTGRLLDGNEKIQEMFGYPVVEFLKLQVGEFSSGEPQYSQEKALHLIHAAASGVPQVFEWHCRRRNGELFWVEVSLRQAMLLGRSIVLAIVRDISERKAFEAQLRQSQKLESIGTLASGVAHEINNPLMGMINYAELISSRIGDESLRAFAEGIKEEGDRVAKIVRNLLSFSRHDQEMHSPARMTDIVDASLSLIGSLLRKDFIQMEIDVPEDLPIVRCRSQQMQQVFINLVTNARDSLNTKYATASEDKRLRITSRVLQEGDKSWLRSTVEDSGYGIPEDVASRIFDPFFTTKARNEGTGLGLSISYGIVRDHSGRLTVESKPGQFTRFHVDLPLADDA